MSQSAPDPSSPAGQRRLVPTLGIFSATMLVAGGVIGSGIFRKPGIMAAQVGSPEVLLGIWLIAGLISLLGTLSNAELASMMPEKDGLETIMEIRRITPNAKIIAMSGVKTAGPMDPLALAARLGARQSLRKPFLGEELLHTISDLLHPATVDAAAAGKQ